MSHPFRHWALGIFGALLLLGVSQGLCTKSSLAAQRVTLKYGPFGRTVAVADLRQYATTGEASSDLASVLQLVKSKQRESFQKGLNKPLPLTAFCQNQPPVICVDKQLRSPIGQQLLPQVAKITPLPGDGETAAISSALVLAAGSDAGLTPLSFLEAFPTPHMTVDVKALQKVLKSSSGLGALLGGFGQ